MKDTPKRRDQAAKREAKRHLVSLTEHLPGLTNHDSAAIERAIVVVNNVRRQEQACNAAHGHVEQAAPATERARAAFMADLDVLTNAKMIESLCHAFRLVDDPDYPLFPGTDWMRDNLTATAVGILTNIYCECQAAEEPTMAPEIDRDTIERVIATSVAHFSDDIPELVLSPYEREWLTQLVILTSWHWHQERARAAGLLQRAERLVAQAREASGDPKFGMGWSEDVLLFAEDLPERYFAGSEVEDEPGGNAGFPSPASEQPQSVNGEPITARE